MAEKYYNKSREPTDEEKSYIRNHFFYDVSTGIITRDDRKNCNGCLDKDGYLIMKVKKRAFKAHRLAWFLFYGVFPTKEIDHINRDRKDNRISNLREVYREENVLNIPYNKNKETGIVGVYIDKCTQGLKKVFTTRIKNKTFRFYTLEDAVDFRIKNNKAV